MDQVKLFIILTKKSPEANALGDFLCLISPRMTETQLDIYGTLCYKSNITSQILRIAFNGER